MRPVPHDYQLAAIRATRDHIRAGARRILIVAPVGAGKTTIGAEIIHGAMERGSRAMFIAHRKELVDQASKRLDRYAIPHGIIMPSSGRKRPNAQVQVAMVQTLARRGYAQPVDLILADEAHRAAAKTWRSVLERYPNAVILGLTATPWRLDGTGLCDIFEEMVEVCQPRDLIDRTPAVLVAPRCFSLAMPDLGGVKLRKGEFDPDQLEELMATQANMDEILSNWRRLAADRQTIVFATTIKHSQMIVDAFGRAGVQAAHVDGTMPTGQRAAILRDFEAGLLQVVSNVNILTEGYDYPALGCVVMARPTQSLSLYIQMAGRVMRTAPGKADAFLLDHAGNVIRHGKPEWPRAWDLAGKSKRAASDAPVTICSECFAAYESSADFCPNCGHTAPAPAPQEVQTKNRGDLVEMSTAIPEVPMPTLEKRDRWMLAYWSPTPTQEQKRGLYDELARRCLANDHKTGWVAHGFKNLFGHWPNWAQEHASPHHAAIKAKKLAEKALKEKAV